MKQNSAFKECTWTHSLECFIPHSLVSVILSKHDPKITPIGQPNIIKRPVNTVF